MSDLSEAFYISIDGMFVGFLGLTIRYCLKSKCDEVMCCGLHIHRRVDLENSEDSKKEDNTITI